MARLASTVSTTARRCGVFFSSSLWAVSRSIRKAAVVALFGLLLAVSLLPELFLAGGAE